MLLIEIQLEKYDSHQYSVDRLLSLNEMDLSQGKLLLIL